MSTSAGPRTLACNPPPCGEIGRQIAKWPADRLTRIAATLLLATQAGLLAFSATQHSPTHLEPAFLSSGLSHWQYGRFELYRVNPPLVRMVAALPILAVGCETDWTRFHDSPGSRSEFPVGDDFVKANGQGSVPLFIYARWACIPFNLIGAYFAYRWARELYRSRAAGLITLTLFILEPNLLAHGELITPEGACTAFGILAGYTFWRWLNRPTWTRAALAGFAMGLAELTKMSWLILFGLWPMLWLVWRYTEFPQNEFSANGTMEGKAQSQPSVECPITNTAAPAIQLATILLLAVYAINLGYAFDGFATPLKDFQFVSTTLTGLDKPGVQGNRFRETPAGAFPVPLPKQYVLGFDNQKKDLEDFHQKSYLRGEWKDGGWWYYYLYGLAVKVPCGIWGLFLLVILYRLSYQSSPAPLRDELVLLAPACTLLAIVSSQTEFNIHLRYVFPSLGLFLIFLGSAGIFLAYRHTLCTIFALTLIGYTTVSTLLVFPNHLAYFNDFVGGPVNGHKHLLGSSLDWGQGTLDAAAWIRVHYPTSQVKYEAWDSQVIRVISGTENQISSKTDGDLKPGLIAFSADRYYDYGIHTYPENSIVKVFPSGMVLVEPNRGQAITDQNELTSNDRHLPTSGKIDSRSNTPQTQIVVSWNKTQSLRIVPLIPKPHFATRNKVSPDIANQILRRVVPLKGEMTASLCLHAISSHGLEGHIDSEDFPSSQSLLDLFLDDKKAKAYFGYPALIRSRYGIRPSLTREESKSATEGHHDQTLACLSQLGLPLSQEMRINDQILALRELFSDSIASFDLKQREVEWSAIAYLAYMPPQRSWRNKFDEQFTFEDLANELLSRDLAQSSCCGCHLVEALIALLTVDREVSPILSPEIRTRINDRIDALIALAWESQFPDGSWEPLWHRGEDSKRGGDPLSTEQIGLHMLATSHVLHWMMYVPAGKSIEATAYDRAVSWLQQYLVAVDDDFIRKNYCPYSHGAWVLRDLSTRSLESN